MLKFSLSDYVGVLYKNIFSEISNNVLVSK